MMDLLIKNGAIIDKYDNENNTALYISVDKGKFTDTTKCSMQSNFLF